MDVPRSVIRLSTCTLIRALIAAGDLAARPRLRRCLGAGPRRGRAAEPGTTGRRDGDLDLEANRLQDADVHLEESLQLHARTGSWLDLCEDLDHCGLLCAATGRHAEAATVWAAMTPYKRHDNIYDPPLDARRRDKRLRQARRALGPARTRVAEERGAAMSLNTAAEYALTLTDLRCRDRRQALGRSVPRERELVTPVARGRANARIAARLYISVRTVGSHLDRIRDKTGCRRRAVPDPR